MLLVPPFRCGRFRLKKVAEFYEKTFSFRQGRYTTREDENGRQAFLELLQFILLLSIHAFKAIHI